MPRWTDPVPNGLRRWYVTDQAGLSHYPRESDGVHHSAQCGRYVRGEVRPVLPDRPARLCPECQRKTDTDRPVICRATDEQPPPLALTMARGVLPRGSRRRGLAGRQPNH